MYQGAAHGSEPELLLQHNGTNMVNSFSPDNRLLLFSRSQVTLANGLYLLDLATREVRALTTSDTEAAHTNVTWAKDGNGLYLTTDRDRDFRGLAYMDLATGALTWLQTPNWDVEQATLSPDGRLLAYAVNAGGKSDLFLRDLTTGANRQVAIPQGVLSQILWAPDSDALALTLDGSAQPMNIWLYDVISGALRQLTFAPQGGIPGGTFQEAELVSYPSFDGLQIPAWLYLPEGARKGDGLPAIVSVTVAGEPVAGSLQRRESVFHPPRLRRTRAQRAWQHRLRQALFPSG